MDLRIVMFSVVGVLHGGWALAEDCTKAPDERALRQCVSDALAASEAELAFIYAQIEGRLADNVETSGLLARAQSSWVAYRDSACSFQSAGVAGGSVQPMIVSMCRDTLTRSRITALQPYLECQEGDLGCPVPRAD